MGFFKKITKISFIYLLGQMGSKFISIIMLPIYTNYISPTDYGTFDVVVAYMSILVPFFCLEVWSGMLRFALTKDELDYKYKVLSNSLVICCVGIAILSCGLLIVWLGFDLQNVGYIAAYMISLILMYITTIACRAFNENRLYAFSGILSVFVNAIVSIVCIFGFHMGLETLFISAIAANFSQVILVELKLSVFRNFSLRYCDKTLIKKLFRFCFPLSINSVFAFLLSNVNRIIIVYKMADGEAANGIYAVATKLTVFVTMLVSIFFMAWQEVNYQEENSQVRARNCATAYKLFIKLVGIGTIILVIATKVFFPLLIGEDYQEAFFLIPFFYFATYLQSISGFTATFFSIENKTEQLIISKVFGGGVNVIIVFLLINQYGLLASPIALIVSQIVVILIQFVQYRKFIRIPFEFKTIAVITFWFIVSSLFFFKGNVLGNLLFGVFFLLVAMVLCRDILKKIASFRR